MHKPHSWINIRSIVQAKNNIKLINEVFNNHLHMRLFLHRSGNFLKQFKIEFTPKSSGRQKVLQTSNFTASWVTRPCLQLLTTKNTKMQRQN